MIVLWGALFFFFFQAEDGIRYLVRSRGLGDVYKRQVRSRRKAASVFLGARLWKPSFISTASTSITARYACLLYTSDAADERSSVDLGGRRIIKKKKKANTGVEKGYSSKCEQEHHTKKPVANERL